MHQFLATSLIVSIAAFATATSRHAEADDSVSGVIRANSKPLAEIRLARPAYEGQRAPIPAATQPAPAAHSILTSPLVHFHWSRPHVTHQPLYFDQPGVEIGGYSRGPVRQPLASGIDFFSTTIVLPLKMLAEPPGQAVTYPPGTPLPGSPSRMYKKRLFPSFHAGF